MSIMNIDRRNIAIIVRLLVINVLFLTVVNDLNSQPVKLWETDIIYKKPESVVYDSIRGFIYTSNYGQSMRAGVAYGNHYISKTTLNGELVEARWIEHLTTPTGLCIFGDMLYVVERFGVVKYDLKKDKLVDRFFIPLNGFLNDITVSPDTSIYITVSDRNIIYKIKNRKVEEWLKSEKIFRPNGILFDRGKLIVGVNGDNCLKAIDISNKRIEEIAHFGAGIIDGVIKCNKGYLVSQLEGNLYLIDDSKQVNNILAGRAQKISIADFEYIEGKGMIIVPDLKSNRLIAYQYRP